MKKEEHFNQNEKDKIRMITYPDTQDESAGEAKKTNEGANSLGCAGRLMG